MNKFAKQIVAICVGLLIMTSSVVAQGGRPGHQKPQAQAAEAMVAGPEMMGCTHQGAVNPLEFSANEVCYIPEIKAFVMIDSIDCSVDMLVRDNDTLRRFGRFTTDVFTGRHDLPAIVRPKSVSVMGDQVVLLASAKKDTSVLYFIHIDPEMCQGSNDSLQADACIGFHCSSFAFQINPMDNEILVVGKNPVGYDINVVDLDEGADQVSAASTFHYHVPKQSERIQASDPVGVGLTVVAIVVVFLLLTLICFIMKGFAAGVTKVQGRKAAKSAPQQGAANTVENPSKVSGEVYAAIAAAIYAYDQDMHDEEDTVITIQKVERAWTPWNAKFYNMNQYFSNRK